MTEPGKITIKLRLATCYRPGPRHAPRIDMICGCAVPAGVWDVREIPPGVAFEIPEDEGLALLKVHAGEIVGARHEKPPAKGLSAFMAKSGGPAGLFPANRQDVASAAGRSAALA